VPWTLDRTLESVRIALVGAGFAGARLTGLSIETRTGSGRVARIALEGLQPATTTGEQLRLALGPRDLRSTAFSVMREGDVLRFTGRGYGHGVGMCVVGAGRRARRGEDVAAILRQYYPGLDVVNLGDPSVGRLLRN
jgi:stage II sporulation protein D